MDKLENLKKLKQLFDDGVLSEKEYSEMKNEILNIQNVTNEKTHKEIDTRENERNSIKGNINLIFKGVFMLMDAKIKIHVDNELIATESLKKGFNISIPVKKDTHTFKIIQSLLISTKTEFTISELQEGDNCTVLLEYDRTTGTFSNNIKIN